MNLNGTSSFKRQGLSSGTKSASENAAAALLLAATQADERAEGQAGSIFDTHFTRRYSQKEEEETCSGVDDHSSVGTTSTEVDSDESTPEEISLASLRRWTESQKEHDEETDVKCRVCICGWGALCKEMTDAFSELDDPRSRYTPLPQLPMAYDVDSLIANQVRLTYLRHILPSEHRQYFDDSWETRYIANHHFHPKLVAPASVDGNKCKLPLYVSKKEMKRLQMGLTESDRVLNEHGEPISDYYFVVPNYHQEKVKRDLVRLMSGETETPEQSDVEDEDASVHTTNQTDVEDEEEVSETLKQDPENGSPADRCTVDANTVRAAILELFAFESERRSKSRTAALQLRASRDLLLDGVSETARAERLVIGALVASQAYAEAMAAIYDDRFVDDDGNTLAGSWKQSRLSVQRGAEDYVLQEEAAMGASGRHSDGTRNGSMLNALIETQSVCAEQIMENSKLASTGVAHEMTLHRQELEARVNKMVQFGDSIASELELAEARASETWIAYQAMANKWCRIEATTNTSRHEIGPGLLSPATPEQKASKHEFDAPSPTSVATSPTISPGVCCSCPDLWLSETRYRVAVEYQSTLWLELAKVWDSTADIEYDRRVKLHEFLLDFAPRQKRLFSSITTVAHSALQDMVERRDLNQHTEEHIGDAILRHAETLQKQETEHRSSIINRFRRMGEPIERGCDTELITLSSPLMSPFSITSKVLERTNDGTSWQKTLAVITADSYLHLFDLPSSSEKEDLAPEEAFEELRPAFKVPTVEDITERNEDSKKGLLKNLIPTTSLFLSNCSVTPSLDEKREFQLTEVRSWKFGMPTTLKVLLRTGSPEETMKWIEIITFGTD